MATSVAHFVSLKMGLIDALGRIRPVATVRHGARVPMIGMKAVVDAAVEIGRPVKPGT
jgi:hypothetical protein